MTILLTIGVNKICLILLIIYTFNQSTFTELQKAYHEYGLTMSVRYQTVTRFLRDSKLQRKLKTC